MSPVERLTPRAPGAIAVLAVRGEGPVGRLRELAGRLPEQGRLMLVRLRAGEELLDEALLVGLGPLEFEVHLHGGTAVVARVATELGGAELGGAGEPQEAGLEGRARALLAAVPAELGARILLDQAEGALRRDLERLRAETPARAAARAAELAARARLAAPLLRPPRVVLAGPTNAGKSTLFNVLLGEERALAHAQPGTTRDAVSGRSRLGELVVEWVDTAGERELGGVAGAGEGLGDTTLERAGQGLARQVRSGADLVLWLEPADGPQFPSTRPAAAPGAPPLVVVESRADRPSASGRSGRGPRLSALGDPQGAREAVASVLAGQLPHGGWTPGQGVPFEPDQVSAILAAGAERGTDRRARLLARCLDPRR
jgi:tRNA modification GTPase